MLAEEYEKTKEHLGQLTADVDSQAVKKKQLLMEIEPLSQKVSTLTKEKGDRESQLKVLIKKADEWKSKVAEAEKEKSGLVKEIKELRCEKTKLSSEVDGKEESLARLNNIGFMDEDLLRLRTIIERIAGDNSTDAKGIKERFFVALGSFGDLVELDKRRKVEMENMCQLTEKESFLDGEIQELEKRKAILLGEIGQATSSVAEGIKGVGEKAVSELQLQVEDIRGKFNALITDAMRTASVVGEMKAMVKKGEESAKDITDFIAQVKAGLGRN
jgi:FtsZ-binding cell division protein ZapB